MDNSVLFEKFSRYCCLSKIAGRAEHKNGDVISIASYKYRVISRFEDKGTSTEGHIFQRLDRENKFVLAFKGSVEFIDWLSDFRFSKQQWPFAQCPTKKVELHSGFIDNYASVRNDILSTLKDILTKATCRPILTICGHSLGGALTAIATLDIKLYFKDSFDLSTYTFGSPRVFNRTGAELFAETVRSTYAYRITYDKDIVPNVPLIGFTHVGKLFHLYEDVTFDNRSYFISILYTKVTQHPVQQYIDLLRKFANKYVKTVKPKMFPLIRNYHETKFTLISTEIVEQRRFVIYITSFGIFD